MGRSAEIIRLIGPQLRSRRTEEELRTLAAAFGEEELADAVEAMVRVGTLTRGLRGDWFMLSERGRVSLAKGTLEHRSLGLASISSIAKAAVLHVVVEMEDGDEASGSGFLVEDYPNCVITAAHVIGSGNRIRRIEDARGAIACEPIGMRLGERDLDLGILRVSGLSEQARLRIEWEATAVDQNDSVFVFGYPSLAGLQPAVEISEARVTAVNRLTGSGRGTDEKSLILSAKNVPGHSGGPVLSADGLVVGVVDQESLFTTRGAVTSRFSATPVVRLRDVENAPEITPLR